MQLGILSEPPKDPIMIVENLIPNGLTLLAGQPGAGKSWFGVELAAAITNNMLFMGTLKVKEGPVVYVDLEAGPVTHARAWNKVNKERFYLLEGPTMQDGSEATNFWTDWLLARRAAGLPDPVMVIFDSLSMVHGGDENSAEDMAPLMKKFRELGSLIPDAAIVIIHHSRKPPAQGMDLSSPIFWVRGSSAIVAAVDTVIVLTTEMGMPERSVLPAKYRLMEAPEPFAFVIERLDKTAILKYMGKPANRGQTALEIVKEKIMAMLNDDYEHRRLEIGDVFKHSGISVTTVELSLRDLEMQGKIYRVRRGWYRRSNIQGELHEFGKGESPKEGESGKDVLGI